MFVLPCHFQAALESLNSANRAQGSLQEENNELKTRNTSLSLELNIAKEQAMQRDNGEYTFFSTYVIFYFECIHFIPCYIVFDSIPFNSIHIVLVWNFRCLIFPFENKAIIERRCQNSCYPSLQGNKKMR